MQKISLKTKDSKEWETPSKLFHELDKEFNFILDPCATRYNYKCSKYITKEEDGLILDWYQSKSVFINPPYGRGLYDWIRKAYNESRRGCTVVCLLPVRTDTKWFHDYCIRGEIRFLKGRLKFGSSKNSAPFPSMIVIFKEPLK